MTEKKDGRRGWSRGALLVAGLCGGCGGGDDDPKTQVVINPVQLPDPGVAGYAYPETEATVYGWVEAKDAPSIAKHAWGLWIALTSETAQEVDGQKLRVFETWYTPDDIQAEEGAARDVRPTETLNQLRGAAEEDARITGFVKYDPTAADFARTNDLLSATTLNALLADGARDIPAFPSTAVTIKPAFLKLSQSAGRYQKVAAWPGPPEPAKAFPSKDWGQCVWIDTEQTGDGPGTGAVDTTCDDGSRTDATTYGLGRFVTFEDGDAVYVLKAMHVTTKESTRWTWQTFWWTPTPDAPKAPSSAAVASARPPQLTGAPSNYAHCSSYQMLDPVQPETGGTNAGQPVYCYNPWLEAAFGPTDLPNSTPLGSVSNDVGVQSNCMSCHAYASWVTDNSPDPQTLLYTGDRYVDLQSTELDGHLRLDFAWSIQQTARGD